MKKLVRSVIAAVAVTLSAGAVLALSAPPAAAQDLPGIRFQGALSDSDGLPPSGGSR